MTKKVFIGVGHGGSDPGACANGLKEKDLNLSTALYCRTELERHGVTVLMSRYKDENDPLEERIKECNAFNPDLAADIHYNAGGGDGAEVYHSERDRSDDALAKNILDEITKAGQNSRGLKTKTRSDGSAYFGFVRQIKCPAVLVECAFIDTAKDIAIADTEAERKALGIAIAKGFLKTLGIAYVPPVEDTEGGVYRVQVGAYNDRAGAEALLTRLKSAGFDGFIVEDEKEPTKKEEPAKPAAPAPAKDLNAVVNEILYGKNKYGDGEARKQALRAEGYTEAEIKEIQKIINKIYYN